MMLSSRERFLIGVLFTIIIWAVALEVFIWPCRAGYQRISSTGILMIFLWTGACRTWQPGQG